MKPQIALTALSMALLLSACGGEPDSTQARGPDPKLPEPQRGLLPSMKIAEPVAWGDQKPDSYTQVASCCLLYTSDAADE